MDILSSRPACMGGNGVEGAPLEVDGQVFCRQEVEAEDGFGDSS